MSKSLKITWVIVLFLLVSPVFLFIYQPAWRLGGLGLVLGGIGYFISPIVIIGVFAYWTYRTWKD